MVVKLTEENKAGKAKMRILLVEDEKNLALEIKEVLEKENYSVDLAFDGEAGYEKAFVEDYDLIILDIMLPFMDGIEVLQNLRRDGIDTPVLLLTAKSTVEDKVKGLDCGADDYLTKPFAIAELLARIRALLRRKYNEKNAVLKIADLELNPATHEVFRSGVKIDLTPKEYAILEYMMYNKNRVLTRLSIAEHVWGDSFDPFTMSNFVDVHIKNLRKKIDRSFSPRLIHTVRGVGYILKEEDEDKD